MIKDIIKIQTTHGYTIDVSAEISSEYDSAAGVTRSRDGEDIPEVPTSQHFIPFRLTFLGPPNIRGQRPEPNSKYYTFVGITRG